MFCNHCGKKISDQAAACPECGHPTNAPEDISPKSKTTAILLCLFFGPLGVHRFYVGKIGTGILQLITFGGFGIWSLIDLIMVICGKFKDKNDKPLAN